MKAPLIWAGWDLCRAARATGGSTDQAGNGGPCASRCLQGIPNVHPDRRSLLLKINCTRRIWLAAVLLCGLAGGLHARAADIVLQVGITGEDTLAGLDDPVHVLKLPEVSRLMERMADRPRGAKYVRQALAGSAVDLGRLLDLHLVRSWNQKYAINFNYLTLQDQATLIRVLTPYAYDLARSYQSHWNEFDSLFRAYNGRGVATGEVAFAVIGALSLDWDGLDLTAKKGLRMTAETLPGGRDFIVWAKERSPATSLKGLYWGSHSEIVRDVQFTSFGDHGSLPRVALPDLLWRTRARISTVDGVSRSVGSALDLALRPYYESDFLVDVGRILRLLRRSPAACDSLAHATGIDKARVAAILRLLVEMQYIRKDRQSCQLVVPFFSIEDKPMIDAARVLSRRIMAGWLDRNFLSIQDSLRDLAVLRYGVPYRQLFTEVWHFIFGLTNRALVEGGQFADPYAADHLSKGVVPFVIVTAALGSEAEATN